MQTSAAGGPVADEGSQLGNRLAGGDEMVRDALMMSFQALRDAARLPFRSHLAAVTDALYALGMYLDSLNWHFR